VTRPQEPAAGAGLELLTFDGQSTPRPRRHPPQRRPAPWNAVSRSPRHACFPLPRPPISSPEPTLARRSTARPMSTLPASALKTTAAIEDVQSHPDSRHIPIDKVGIKDVYHPVRVKDRSRGEQHTIACFNMYVALPHHFKGTHMSRFVEVLQGN